MDPTRAFQERQTRRLFFKNGGLAAGKIALATLLGPGMLRSLAATNTARAHPPLAGLPHFTPKARRLIYLFMNRHPAGSTLGR